MRAEPGGGVRVQALQPGARKETPRGEKPRLSRGAEGNTRAGGGHQRAWHRESRRVGGSQACTKTSRCAKPGKPRSTVLQVALCPRIVSSGPVGPLLCRARCTLVADGQKSSSGTCFRWGGTRCLTECIMVIVGSKTGLASERRCLVCV